MRSVLLGLALLTLPLPVAAKKPSIPDLANQICTSLEIYDTAALGNSREAFEFVVLDNLNLPPDSGSASYGAVKEFWNTHHDQMICTEEMQGYHSPQHILKRIVDIYGVDSFFLTYFLNIAGIQLNTIEQTTDGPETLLDYVDKRIEISSAQNSGYVSELLRLRHELEVREAKRAAELLAEHQIGSE